VIAKVPSQVGCSSFTACIHFIKSALCFTRCFYSYLHSMQGLKSRIIGHENGLPDPETSAIDIAVNRIYMKAEKHFEKTLMEEVFIVQL